MGRKPLAETRIREAGESSADGLKKERKRYRERHALTIGQQALALHYLPLARTLAKPLKIAWPRERDEFESSALLALVEAAQSYDPSQNVKFATFARFRILGALRDVQRGLIASGWQGDLENAPVFISFTPTCEEHGRVINCVRDRPIEDQIDAVEEVENWLRKLPEPHAEACREIYLCDKSQCAAAVSLGCSRSHLSKLKQESVEMLNDVIRWKNRACPEAEKKTPREDEGLNSEREINPEWC